MTVVVRQRGAEELIERALEDPGELLQRVDVGVDLAAEIPTYPCRPTSRPELIAERGLRQTGGS